MNKYPVNEEYCDHAGCERTDTTPCIITDYRPRSFPFRQYVAWFGIWGAIRHLWKLWRVGYDDLPVEYYCPKHAKEEGFCWGCGGFWAGADYGFDFRGEWLCPNCRGDLVDYDDFDDGDDWEYADWNNEEWYAEWDYEDSIHNGD